MTEKLHASGLATFSQAQPQKQTPKTTLTMFLQYGIIVSISSAIEAGEFDRGGAAQLRLRGLDYEETR